jgi:hypothetical protein
MSEVVELSSIETPDLKLSPTGRDDVSMFITCWTLEFMCMAIALKLDDGQVSKIAEVGEFLKLCLGLTTVMKGGRRRQRGGDDGDEEIRSALATIANKPPSSTEVAIREKIKKVQGQLVEARSKALGKFQKGPSMAHRIIQLLASAGIAFMPIADKLITLGIKLKSEQYKAAAAAAAVSAPVQVAATAVGDAALTALVGADIAFAAVGKAGVDTATAAGTGIADTYNWFGQKITSIKESPGTRAEGEKQALARKKEAAENELKTLQAWAVTDAKAAAAADYENYFNSTADLLSQQPPQALEIGTEARRAKDETEGAQIVKGIRANRKTMAEGVKVLEGFKNFMSPFNTYMFMVAYLFKDHTMTYIQWSNVLGRTIAGIVAEDPITVLLCLTWVMSALVGVSYVARLLDALTTQVELKTQVQIEESSAAALELKQLEKDLRELDVNNKLKRLLADGEGGRRSTSRRRRRAAYLPRQTRRSSSGRRRGYSRRRRV